jgi:hypothetical protein
LAIEGHLSEHLAAVGHQQSPENLAAILLCWLDFASLQGGNSSAVACLV